MAKVKEMVEEGDVLSKLNYEQGTLNVEFRGVCVLCPTLIIRHSMFLVQYLCYHIKFPLSWHLY
jgi:hypothetical protein